MPGPWRLFSRIAPFVSVLFLLALLSGCGERAAEKPAADTPAPQEPAGRPQVINFWQPG